MKRGYFGIGIYHTKTEHNIGTLLRSAHCFGASFVFTVGRRYRRQASDTTNASAHMPLYHFDDMDSLQNNLPIGCQLVGVELTDSAKPLNAFDHPQSCAYLLGAEDHGLPPAVLERCHDVLVIPGLSFCLNVSVAGSIVLYDRMQYRRSVAGPRRSNRELQSV